VDEKRTLKRRYRLAVELIETLRQYRLFFHVECPKCGTDGILTTLATRGYVYLVVRHPDKSTHSIPLIRIDEVICSIGQDLLRIFEVYKRYNAELCADRNLKPTQST
jgi:hypothetical protein